VADSWRIQPRESLFDYAQGESTETFQLYGFPDPATTIDDLPPEVRHAALVQCLEARLTDKFALDSCVLDRACEVVGMEEDGDFEMGPVAEGVSEDIGIEPSAGLRMVGIPSSVLLDTFEDSHAIRAFREVESFPVFHDISVDVSAPGAVQRPEDFSPSVIPAGTSIDSYLIHMDPERTATRAVLGRLTFPRPIVGVIVTSTNLNQSADVLNAPGTVYPERASRGLELDGDDLFEIDPDGHSMTIQLHARDDFDQIRVLVEGGAL
jgi:hypothetical protein